MSSLFCPPSSPRLQTLYKTIDRNSIPQLLAFYELYPDTYEGKKSLQQAWTLLSGSMFQKNISESISLDLSHPAINAIIALVNKQPMEEMPSLNKTDLAVIETLAKGLANRKLKGYSASTEAEVLALNPNEIDLARGLLISS